MSAAVAEPLDAMTINNSKPSTARAEASRTNGARSNGPVSHFRKVPKSSK